MAQTQFPLRSNKTVSWAPVFEQIIHERALVESSGSGERHHRHLGLGLRRRGEDGALPVPGMREDSSSGSSGESVYFSASSDDDDDNNDDVNNDFDYSNNNNQGDHMGSQAQDRPVSSRTRSRHSVSGGLLAMVHPAVDRRVDGEEQRSDGIGGRQLDSYTHVKLAKTATLWSVRGFLNVESPVDIGLFDHSCHRMEDLLEARTANSKLQRMTFHTTLLAAKRACATVEDWPHLFRGMRPSGGTHNGSAKREKRQLHIGAALGTVFGGILWNEMSDWV